MKSEKQKLDIFNTKEQMDPFKIFQAWFEEAKNHPKIDEHNRMSLSYCDKKGNPGNNMMLLKDYDVKGFVFYTNYNSRKGKILSENPKAAICFY